MQTKNWVFMTIVLLSFPAMIVAIRFLSWWFDRKGDQDQQNKS